MLFLLAGWEMLNNNNKYQMTADRASEFFNIESDQINVAFGLHHRFDRGYIDNDYRKR